MRSTAHSKLRISLAARMEAWRSAARDAFRRSAEISSTSTSLDYRAAALQEAADDIEAILTADDDETAR